MAFIHTCSFLLCNLSYLAIIVMAIYYIKQDRKADEAVKKVDKCKKFYDHLMLQIVELIKETTSQETLERRLKYLGLLSRTYPDEFRVGSLIEALKGCPFPNDNLDKKQ